MLLHESCYTDQKPNANGNSSGSLRAKKGILHIQVISKECQEHMLKLASEDNLRVVVSVGHGEYMKEIYDHKSIKKTGKGQKRNKKEGFQVDENGVKKAGGKK